MMARVRVENSRSRPRSRVTLATSATRIAGTAAITPNRPTTWTCSRAAERARAQTDDLAVRRGGGAAAAAGLNHEPDLVGDNADQQEDGQGVDQQQGDDH